MSGDSGIRHAAVIGLGTMGHGIAQSLAAAGYEVAGYDDNPAARESLHARVRANLDDFAAAGLIANGDIETILLRIKVAGSESDAVRDAQFVIEAIVEDLSLKQELFERLESSTAETTILASNSSTFPISQSGARLRRPERALVTHWFNPPHIVPTVEVVGGPETSEETIGATLSLLRRAGKLAVRINQELPGFLVNRIQVAVQREVWDLLDRGVASAEDIDTAIRGSMGFRLAALGPLMIHDFGGLDVQTAVFRNLAPEIASGTEVPESVQRTVDGGNYGFKSGRGFYEYPPDTAEQLRSERDRRYLELLKLFHRPPAPDE